MKSVFHFAFNVTDLDEARRFYGGVLGCAEGRSTATWVDFDFFGHQISLHLGEPFKTELTGQVGDVRVPMPHSFVLKASRANNRPCSSVIRSAIRWKSSDSGRWMPCLRPARPEARMNHA